MEIFMIRLATVFSGIGSIEWALKRLELEHEIVFACDNGERYLSKTFEELNLEIVGLNEEEKKLYIDNIYERTGKKILFK